MANNRVNHDFQILHFIIGSCHTPDGAYAKLKDLQENRIMALNSAKVAKLKERVIIEKAKQKLNSEDKIERLEGEAELAEIESFSEVTERNIKAAEAELKFIEDCIEKLQPHRKYKHLSDPEAHEAHQQEEWKYELIDRAKNSLLTTGSISPDEFKTMKMHPEFVSEILPAIDSCKRLMSQGKVSEILLESKQNNILLLTNTV